MMSRWRALVSTTAENGLFGRRRVLLSPLRGGVGGGGTKTATLRVYTPPLTPPRQGEGNLVELVSRFAFRRAAAFAWAVAIGALALLASPASAAQPGVLVTGDNLPANVDPHQIFDVPMQLYSLNTYDNLYRYEGNPPELRPWLAQSHTVSADGLTWEFKLRPGAKFHDGSEITADDVVYSFRRVLALGKAPSGAFKPVLKPDNVTAPDKYTVRFVLDHAYAPFLAAVPIVMVVNPREVKAHETNNDWGAAWLASNAAGSGAYVLDAATYRPLERVDLKRN